MISDKIEGMNTEIKKLIESAQKIVIVQAENPDGDSIGSALALEEVLGDMSKQVSLHCFVEIPKYLRYIAGWDRISIDFDVSADLAIIVDTTSRVLLNRTLEMPGVQNFFEKHPVVVTDHHVNVESDLPFEFKPVIGDSVATATEVYKLCVDSGWAINASAATSLFIGIQSDSLGLSTENVTAETFKICGELVGLGANPAAVESARRELMKKSPEILEYKGRLLQRVEYFLDGQLALVHVPWDEIEEYSDKYNPTMLVLDEMRLVNDVRVAIGIKTYPDGKLTGKLRADIPVCDQIAGFFGGGGHPYASGFRIYEKYDDFLPELMSAVDKVLKEYDEE
jgi:phosphoesterase RecJ-like protein